MEASWLVLPPPPRPVKEPSASWRLANLGLVRDESGRYVPPDEKRCTKIVRFSGERCRLRRARRPDGSYSEYCRAHGGRTDRRHTAQVLQAPVRLLPMIYQKYMTRTLSDAIREATNVSPAEQLRLFEELALIRESIGPSIQIYGAAREASLKEPENEKLREAALAAGQLLRDQLAEVVKTCDVAARIDAAAKDKVSVHTLHHFVNQLVVCAHKVFGDDPRVAELDQTLRETVRIPGVNENEGTSITPDQDVLEMDATIPRA